jgi:hypothetical protein
MKKTDFAMGLLLEQNGLRVFSPASVFARSPECIENILAYRQKLFYAGSRK